ncbi:MAG: hypothetical protein J0L84_08670 [Verrucomicrobia bacterium]|nr:hypothetical protein [Verrucomicrobiota bacterium]
MVCDTHTVTTDMDWNGSGDHEHVSSWCRWDDWVTGQPQYSSSTSSGFKPGNSGWGSRFPNSLPFGETLGSTNPVRLLQLADYPEGPGETLTGISLVQADGRVRYGWRHRLGEHSVVELADRADEPVILGVPPSPRWSPVIEARGGPVPPVSDADRAAGVLRRLAGGQRRFDGGVIALTVGSDQRLWGVGQELTTMSDPRNPSGWITVRTNVLFSLRQDAGDYREAAVLNGTSVEWPCRISSTSGGFIYVTSEAFAGPGNSGPVYRYRSADGSLSNIRGRIGRLVHSSLRQLSDGKLYGTVPDGYVRMSEDGEQVEIIPLLAHGITGFNRGVVESADGWLYILGQNGGASGAGGIVRCRRDGSDATRWAGFHGMEWLPSSKSALLVARDGFVYGTRAGEGGDSSLFRVDPSGKPVSLASARSGTACQTDPVFGGGNCHSFNPGIRFAGAPVEGPDGELYGLSGSAIYRVWTPHQHDPGDLRLEPVVQHDDLIGPQGISDPEVWAQSDSGVLFIPTLTGIWSFLPGQHGLQPIFKVHSAGRDGRRPAGPLVRDHQGAIFGVTDNGGIVDEGTLFSASEDGTIGAVLHTFTGSPGNVRKPSGFLVLGNDGWLYGTSQQGDRHDFSPRLYRVHPGTGRFEVLATLPGRFDGDHQPRCGLIKSRTGALIGTTPRGGSSDLGTLYRYDPPTGSLTVIHEFGASAEDRWRAWPELLEAADGLLYGLASGDATNQLNADGLFRIGLTGEGYRILTRLERTKATMQISGGLTETRDGNLYAVRQWTDRPGTNSAFMGEILRFVRSASADEPARMESVFRSPNEGELGLRPSGRLIESPDGSLVGLSQSDIVLYRFQPATGHVEPLARRGRMTLAQEHGSPARHSSPEQLDDHYLVSLADYRSGAVRKLSAYPSLRPVAREGVVIRERYRNQVSVYFGSLFFGDANPPFEARGLPPGVSPESVRYGSIQSATIPAGTYTIQVIGNSGGFWPPLTATNALTLIVEPVPVLADPTPAVLPVGATEFRLTGSVTPSLTPDGITVSWTTSATSLSPAGRYPILPEFAGNVDLLVNYAISTNESVLTLVEARPQVAVDSGDPGVMALTFPGIPGIRYDLEFRLGLADSAWKSLGSIATPSVDPVMKSLRPLGSDEIYVRVTPRWSWEPAPPALASPDPEP